MANGEPGVDIPRTPAELEQQATRQAAIPAEPNQVQSSDRTRRTDSDVETAKAEAKKEGSATLDLLVASSETQGNWFYLRGDKTESQDTRVIVPVERFKGKLGRPGPRVVMTADGPRVVRNYKQYEVQADGGLALKDVSSEDAEKNFDDGILWSGGAKLNRDGDEIIVDQPEGQVYGELWHQPNAGEMFVRAMRESIDKTEAPNIRRIREAHQSASGSIDVRRAAQSLPPRG
jgi:hypothetical protein